MTVPSWKVPVLYMRVDLLWCRPTKDGSTSNSASSGPVPTPTAGAVSVTPTANFSGVWKRGKTINFEEFLGECLPRDDCLCMCAVLGHDF